MLWIEKAGRRPSCLLFYCRIRLYSKYNDELKSKLLDFSSQVITSNKLYFIQPYLKYYSVYINYELFLRTRIKDKTQGILAGITHQET